MDSLPFLWHLAASWFMTGIVWQAQCVSYPAFAEMSDAAFAQAHQSHMRRMGRLVGPVMVFELVVALIWWWQGTWWLPARLGPMVLLALIWLSTGAVQVPLHRRLAADGYDTTLIRRLVHTNWLRTIAWTLKSMWLLGHLVL